MKGIRKNAQNVLWFFITTPKEQMVTLDLVGFMMNGEDIKVKKKLGPYEHY